MMRSMRRRDLIVRAGYNEGAGNGGGGNGGGGGPGGAVGGGGGGGGGGAGQASWYDYIQMGMLGESTSPQQPAKKRSSTFGGASVEGRREGHGFKTVKYVCFVDRTDFELNGSPGSQGMCLGDVTGDGNMDLCVGSVDGRLAVYRGTSGRPWLLSSRLGTILCVEVIQLRTRGAVVPYIAVLSAEGWCRLFTVSGSPEELVESGGLRRLPRNITNMSFFELAPDAATASPVAGGGGGAAPKEAGGGGGAPANSRLRKVRTPHTHAALGGIDRTVYLYSVETHEAPQTASSSPQPQQQPQQPQAQPQPLDSFAAPPPPLPPLSVVEAAEHFAADGAAAGRPSAAASEAAAAYMPPQHTFRLLAICRVDHAVTSLAVKKIPACGGAEADTVLLAGLSNSSYARIRVWRDVHGKKFSWCGGDDDDDAAAAAAGPVPVAGAGAAAPPPPSAGGGDDRRNAPPASYRAEKDTHVIELFPDRSGSSGVERVYIACSGESQGIVTQDGNITLNKDAHHPIVLSEMVISGLAYVEGTDEICLCTWGGDVFFVDPNRNAVRFSLHTPVRSFLQGMYSLSPTETRLCIFCATFDGHIAMFSDVAKELAIVKEGRLTDVGTTRASSLSLGDAFAAGGSGGGEAATPEEDAQLGFSPASPTAESRQTRDSAKKLRAVLYDMSPADIRLLTQYKRVLEGRLRKDMERGEKERDGKERAARRSSVDSSGASAAKPAS